MVAHAESVALYRLSLAHEAALVTAISARKKETKAGLMLLSCCGMMGRGRDSQNAQSGGECVPRLGSLDQRFAIDTVVVMSVA